MSRLLLELTQEIARVQRKLDELRSWEEKLVAEEQEVHACASPVAQLESPLMLVAPRDFDEIGKLVPRGQYKGMQVWAGMRTYILAKHRATGINGATEVELAQAIIIGDCKRRGKREAQAVKNAWQNKSDEFFCKDGLICLVELGERDNKSA